MGKVADLITSKLTDALNPIILELANDSEQHRGHAGYTDGESHFSLYIVADAFTGLNRVARQRLVMHALAEEMKGLVHALSVVAKTPDEVS